MKRLGRWWRFWVVLFDRREPATVLACFRIAVGLILAYSMISTAWAGLVDTLWVDQAHGGFMPIHGNWFLRLVGGATPAVAWSLLLACLVSAALLVIGVASRVAALVALLCYGALVTTHGDTSGGADLLTTNALWMLVLSRCDTTLSAWCRWRTGGWRSSEEVPAWPRYLIVFQLVIVYFAAGVQKTAVPWTPFGGYAALHYVMQDPTWIRWGSDAFVALSPLTRIATAITWHWEQLTPVLLLYFYFGYVPSEKPGWIRRLVTRFDLRVGWVVIGVGLHLGILLTLNVGAFSLIMVTYYLALFRPGELDRSGRWLIARPRAMLARWRSGTQ